MTADKRAQERCRRFEGRVIGAGGRHVRYTCPAGHPTIGYGHRLQDGEEEALVIAGHVARVADGLSEEEALLLFARDWGHSRDAVETLLGDHGIADLDGPRRGVLVEMAFQLGVRGCRLFRRMWAALGRRDYSAAAAEARDSKWRRSDSPRRAERLAVILESGNDAEQSDAV